MPFDFIFKSLSREIIVVSKNKVYKLSGTWRRVHCYIITNASEEIADFNSRVGQEMEESSWTTTHMEAANSFWTSVPSNNLHGVRFHKTEIFSSTAVRTSNAAKRVKSKFWRQLLFWASL
jgi:hypothetical protein